MTHQRKMAMYIGLAAAASLPLPALRASTAPSAPAAQGASAVPTTNAALQAQIAAMAQELAVLKKNQTASQRKEANLEKQIVRLKAQNAKIAASRPATTNEALTKAQFQQLYREVMANSRKISAPAPTNNINQTVQNMFAPPTGENYFSPFRRETPEYNGFPHLHMQIGQFDNMHLYMGLDTVGRFQWLTQHSAYASGFAGSTPDGLTAGQYPGLDPGFQTPFGNLDFLASIPGKLDVFFDLFLASRPDPDHTYGDQGYMVFKQLPAPFAGGPLNNVFNYINVKAGAFIVDFGDGNFHRSNNGFVQRNPLIGNPLVDSSTEEIGAEVYAIKGPVYWLAGVTGGTTEGHVDYGSRPAVFSKIWGYPLPDLRWSASVYYVDLDGFSTVDGLNPGAGEGHNQIMDLLRSGGVYGSVFGGGWDGDPGQITPLNGYDVEAYQTDLTWNHWPWEVYSFVGWTQDSTWGERWLYGSATAVYHINPALYLAGRLSYAFAGAVNGVDSSGWVDRFQIGGGYWFTKSLLAKLEYVYQQYNDFNANVGDVDAVDAYRNPSFNGVLMEMSFDF